MKRRDFAAEAVQDLSDIHDYIARDSPSAARRFIETIDGRCNTLAENPYARTRTAGASRLAAT